MTTLHRENRHTLSKRDNLVEGPRLQPDDRSEENANDGQRDFHFFFLNSFLTFGASRVQPPK